MINISKYPSSNIDSTNHQNYIFVNAENIWNYIKRITSFYHIYESEIFDLDQKDLSKRFNNKLIQNFCKNSNILLHHTENKNEFCIPVNYKDCNLQMKTLVKNFETEELISPNFQIRFENINSSIYKIKEIKGLDEYFVSDFQDIESYYSPKPLLHHILLCVHDISSAVYDQLNTELSFVI